MLDLISEEDLKIGTEFYCIHDTDQDRYYKKTFELEVIGDNGYLIFAVKQYAMGIEVRISRTLGLTLERMRGEVPFSRYNRYCQFVRKDKMEPEDNFYIELSGGNVLRHLY